MTPQLGIDLSSAIPVYEQLRSQIAGMVVTGRLGAGDRLPTVRALAADLGVAVNTVGRAYAALESAGVVTSQRRRGTVVVGGIPAPSPQVLSDAARLAQSARDTGTSPETVLAIVRAALSAGDPDPA